MEKTHKFKTALREQQNVIFNEVTLKFCEMGTEAINTIYSILKNGTSENIKLRASMFIIDKIIQVKDNETISRIDEIEFKLMRGENK